MAVIQILTKQYAVCIYIHGTRNFSSIPAEYHTPVKQYAGETYTFEQIDNTLAKGYITEQEHAETMGYVPTT
ncbi:hypothetical protein [Desulfotomaculum sp. 1211_IL3151]|uniref:hypothetical protein n=1 Tax=Desulfotomaculum sp. 1211_IL3151 TaxID=3084055 RepID=UPI002FDB2F96